MDLLEDAGVAHAVVRRAQDWGIFGENMLWNNGTQGNSRAFYKGAN